MGHTIVEKIIKNHCGREVSRQNIVDLRIDARVARDFGGASVVKHLEERALQIHDPKKTFFTFDCNPAGSDQGYAANQHICRTFARKHGIGIFDIDKGIGTHVAIDRGLAVCGETLVSTDSHANILGAIGAFGQGMGDIDIAHAFAYGSVWFKVPQTVKIILKGKSGNLTPKDLGLKLLSHFGANGLLGMAGEIYGDISSQIDLSGRITISSLATEMGAIILFFPPDEAVINHCKKASKRDVVPVYADDDAVYENIVEIDISAIAPLISMPGHPEDVVSIDKVTGKRIDSVFIGSCTNGRLEDLHEAAGILKGRHVAPWVILKVVPSTDEIWHEALRDGTIEILKDAGALIGNAGCGGCASGQIGQNGPGEVTVSTGNRNFAGKQGKGDVYLTSPRAAAACAISGFIISPDKLSEIKFDTPVFKIKEEPKQISGKEAAGEKPLEFNGKLWVIPEDNIDTDMIFHNKYLSITDVSEMGAHTFSNLKGYEDFAKKSKPGDIIITGKNFGCGSSRAQAVDCFISLGIGAIIAVSFGSIYERNAINSGLPIIPCGLMSRKLKNGEEASLNLKSGILRLSSTGEEIKIPPLTDVQLKIYERGGLLSK